MQKRLYAIYGLFICLTVCFMSCQKTEDPCENILSEGMLKQINIIFIDKETGESLFKIHDLDGSDIKITNAVAGEIYKSGGLIYNSEHPITPYNGIVKLVGIPDTEGEHSYKIQIGVVGSAVIAYTGVKKENKTNDPCSSPYYNSITDIRIVDHPFHVFEYEGKTFPEIVVVEL
ncbi:MAG: hypothetical protein ACTMH4_17175 [Sphingobacterium sp.]